MYGKHTFVVSLRERPYHISLLLVIHNPHVPRAMGEEHLECDNEGKELRMEKDHRLYLLRILCKPRIYRVGHLEFPCLPCAKCKTVQDRLPLY